MKVVREPGLLQALEVEHGRDDLQGLCVLDTQHFQLVQSFGGNGHDIRLGQISVWRKGMRRKGLMFSWSMGVLM